VPGTLASPEQAARLERAIRDRRRVWLRHQGEAGRFRAWPVQLLFHSISWYLAFETAEIGHARGLIRCLRVDRLVLVNEDGNARRSSDAEHDDALRGCSACCMCAVACSLAPPSTSSLR